MGIESCYQKYLQCSTHSIGLHRTTELISQSHYNCEVLKLQFVALSSPYPRCYRGIRGISAVPITVQLSTRHRTARGRLRPRDISKFELSPSSAHAPERWIEYHRNKHEPRTKCQGKRQASWFKNYSGNRRTDGHDRSHHLSR